MSCSPAFALHGGAGVIDPDSFPAERRRAAATALREIAVEAWALLESGTSALDAVELAVVRLEDCELFNAGRGSVLNLDGVPELDAAIMDGNARRAGAVAAALAIRNPVRAARALLEDGTHVLLAGAGADAFAQSRGLPLEPTAYFITEDRRAQWRAARAEGRISLDHDGRFEQPAERRMGTVGAVARDRAGRLAAATSTGGMTCKHPGRVGDTPLVGAGTFADASTCAVSATGHGEYFIRAQVAYDMHARMAYGGATLADAGDAALAAVATMGGDGGLIAVGLEGAPVLPFNSGGMYRAWIDDSGALQVAIYHDPE